MKRMQDWLEKNKKLQARQKKVVEYHKYVQGKTSERLAHKRDLTDTVNMHARNYNQD